MADQWQRALTRIATALQLQRSIKLLESAAVEVPTVVGWIRPVVLLPVASLSGLSTQQIEMILAHELAHIRRHDFIVNLMQSVVETLLFYHPAVWWISRRIRVEREHCCDDLAVAVFGDPLQYARALTRFEELRLDVAQTVIAANGSSLIDRIRRLVAARAESASWSSRWAAGAALLTVVAAILVAPALPLFAKHDDQTPAPSFTAVAPAAAEKQKDPEKCDKATSARARVDVEASADDPDDNDGDVSAEVDANEIAAGVREGIEEGVKGGVEASVRAVPFAVSHVVVPNIDIEKVITSALDQSAAAIAALSRNEADHRPKRKNKIGVNGKLSIDDLITLRTAGVDPKYIEEMRGAGLGELSLDDLASLGVQGVTPAYLRSLREAGVDVHSPETAVALSVQGVSAEYVKALAAAGYSHLRAHELIRLKVSGVDADFIRELSKYRTK